MQEPVNNLVLDISRQANTLKMSAYEHKEGIPTLRHYSSCQISSKEIDRLCEETAFILNKANKPAPGDNESLHKLSKAGQLLFNHLFTRPVKEKLKSSQHCNLILCIDEELISIPWELLNDGDNFLCLKFNLGRLIRTRQENPQAKYRSFSSSLKMLIMANPTGDLKSAYTEGLNIKNQFGRKAGSVSIDFKSTNIDKLYAQKNLPEYDIVHFAGHCEFSADNHKAGWVFNDAKFTVADILNMGQTVALPSLVFSNACFSAKAAEANYSLASAFLFSGVRHYIGTIQRIEDPVSFVFAKEFYAQLISAKALGECVRLARLKQAKQFGIGSLYWAGYLLYGDPGFILFKTALKQRQFKARKILSALGKHVKLLCLSLLLLFMSIYLYTSLVTLNPNTYRLFLKSEGLFQNGGNQEALKICKEIIRREPLFRKAYSLIGDVYFRLGDKERAIKNYFDYAVLCEKKKDTNNLAAAYINIGWVYFRFGEYSRAGEFYEKALSLSRAKKDRFNLAVALRKQAVLFMEKDDYDKAPELLIRSSEINRESANLYNLACDYFDLGLVFTNRGDLESAKGFYQKSRDLFEGLKLKGELSDYYFNLGEIYLLQKQYQKALEFYRKGLAIDKKQDNRINLSSDYNLIGELYLEMGNLLEAEDYFLQALSIAQPINLLPETALAYENLNLVYKAKQDTIKAGEYLRRADEIYRSMGLEQDS